MWRAIGRCKVAVALEFVSSGRLSGGGASDAQAA
jgi:hypothetical protein